MKTPKIILNVELEDVMKAAKIAQDVAQNYRSAVSPKDKVEFPVGNKRFLVHETAKDTIVVNYKSPKK